jgi:uncharacterized glyoxalase superfamily protein PhnB
MPRHAIIPGFQYQNAPAAIDFLCNAFGFQRHAVYAHPQDPNLIMHAELVLNGNMIMLGSRRPDPPTMGYTRKSPEEAGGVTMTLVVIVDDPDGHAKHATAAGARIINAPRDNEGYPGRAYNALDTEGHVWHFTNYDPFA